MPKIIKAIYKDRLEEENVPNDETLSAIKEVERGKVKIYGSAKEMMITLKIKANGGD